MAFVCMKAITLESAGLAVTAVNTLKQAEKCCFALLDGC